MSATIQHIKASIDSLIEFERIREEIILPAHEFSPSKLLRYDETNGWALATNDGTKEQSNVIGIIESIKQDSFILVYEGRVKLDNHGFTLGRELFLGQNGNISIIEPIYANFIKPVAIPIDTNYIMFLTLPTK